MFTRLLALTVFPNAALAQAVPTDPLLELTFDDAFGVGQVIVDQSGHQLDGWSIVDPVRVQGGGLNGDALAFDGKTDHVVLPTDAIEALSHLGQGSVFVRFSYDDLISTQAVVPILYIGVEDTDRTENMLIIEVGHGLAADNHKLYFTWVVDGQLALCFDTDFDLTPGDMYSFVGVVGPKGNSGWLNGQELTGRHYNAGDASTVLFFDKLPRPALQTFTVGRGKALDFLTPDFVNFRGVIDEVQMFDRPLTPKEAAALTAK